MLICDMIQLPMFNAVFNDLTPKQINDVAKDVRTAGHFGIAIGFFEQFINGQPFDWGNAIFGIYWFFLSYALSYFLMVKATRKKGATRK